MNSDADFDGKRPADSVEEGGRRDAPRRPSAAGHGEDVRAGDEVRTKRAAPSSALLAAQRSFLIGMGGGEFDALSGASAPASAEGGAGWLVTFADMMSLLMCFFVMLFSFSQVDVAKFQEVARSMSAALHGKPLFVFEEQEAGSGLLEEAAGVSRQRQTAEHYAELLRRELRDEIARGVLAVDAAAGIITIRILQNGSFAPGSADLQADFLPVARKIRDALVGIPGALTVAGHTDDIPIASGRFRSNWELSGARAFSVMNELLQGGVLEGERFVLMGFAETRPLAGNDTDAHRELNRRVEIIIDQRDLPAGTDVAGSPEMLGAALQKEVGAGVLQLDHR